MIKPYWILTAKRSRNWQTINHWNSDQIIESERLQSFSHCVNVCDLSMLSRGTRIHNAFQIFAYVAVYFLNQIVIFRWKCQWKSVPKRHCWNNMKQQYTKFWQNTTINISTCYHRAHWAVLWNPFLGGSELFWYPKALFSQHVSSVFNVWLICIRSLWFMLLLLSQCVRGAQIRTSAFFYYS